MDIQDYVRIGLIVIAVFVYLSIGWGIANYLFRGINSKEPELVIGALISLVYLPFLILCGPFLCGKFIYWRVIPWFRIKKNEIMRDIHIARANKRADR